MDKRLFPVLISFVMINGFAMFITSRRYTAWCIRIRNQGYFLLLRRESNRERAEHADEIAERHLVWIRPLGFLIANAFVGYLAWQVYSSH